MATLLGKNLQILKNTTGSTYAAVVAMAKSCEVSIECDSQDVASPTNGGWRYLIAGRKSWSISVGYLVSAGSFPAEAVMVGTIITIRVSDGTVQMQGNALVQTWKVSGTVGNLTQGSFKLVGTGPLAPVN